MLAAATYHAHARRPRPEAFKARPAKQIMLAARAANRAQRMHALRRS